MNEEIPQWVRAARKEPQTGTFGARTIEVGAPDPAAGEVYLTAVEDGEPVGHVLPTDPPTYRSTRGGEPRRVDSMQDVLELLDPGLHAPSGPASQ